MEQSILASGTEMVTVAMKRIELDNKEDNMLVHIPVSYTHLSYWCFVGSIGFGSIKKVPLKPRARA